MRLLSACLAALLLGGAGKSQGAPLAPSEAPGLSVSRTVTPSTRLSLKEVLVSVRAHHPQLVAARQTVESAQGSLLAAEGGFDTRWRTKGESTPSGYYERRQLETVLEQPTGLWGTRFHAGYRLGVGKFPDYYGQYETLDGGEVRAGVEVPLWRNGPIDKRRAELSKARLGREAADFVLASEVLLLEREATFVYWEWVAAGRQLSIYQGLLELARLRNQQLATRVARGDVPPVELTENERALRVREADLVSARRKLEQSALKLALFLRDEEGEPVVPDASRLPADLPLPELESVGEAEAWVRRALEQRPELRELALQQRMAGVEVDLAANQMAPAVDVGVFVSRDVGMGPDRLRPTEVQAGLKLDIPLQNRVARGQRDVAAAKRASVDAKTRLARDKVVTGVRDALSALRAAAERVELAREATGIARQLAQAERTSFGLGNTTLLIVNLREELAASAESSEVKALADYQMALADLRAVTGTPAVDG